MILNWDRSENNLKSYHLFADGKPTYIRFYWLEPSNVWRMSHKGDWTNCPIQPPKDDNLSVQTWLETAYALGELC
jgi:hypothetical protein